MRGIPAAQGSKRHVGGGRMIESSRAVGPWREAVRAETQRAVAGPFDGPLQVQLHFWLPRPKSLAKTVIHPAKRPDIDKLARAVLDGLTAGGAWKDDAQVVQLAARKDYANGERLPGCEIFIFLLEAS